MGGKTPRNAGRLLQFVKHSIRNGQGNLSYERAWALKVGSNGLMRDGQVLRNGYYLFYHDTEPYETAHDDNNIHVKCFTFIGPFSDQKAAKEHDRILGRDTTKKFTYKYRFVIYFFFFIYKAYDIF